MHVVLPLDANAIGKKAGAGPGPASDIHISVSVARPMTRFERFSES